MYAALLALPLVPRGTYVRYSIFHTLFSSYPIELLPYIIYCYNSSMTESHPSAALVGGTGLVGSHILNTLLAHPLSPRIHALGRRSLPNSSPNLSVIVNPDTSTWADSLKSLSPPPSIFLSALGTSKAAAGSVAAQRAIDYDLNLSLARTAKESGVQTYVLISSAGVGLNSPFPYGRMKAELEDAVKKLEFPYTVILKPGLLVGTRQETRPAEAFLRGIAKGLGAISKGLLTEWWAQDVDIIARAAVRAGWECVDGKRDKGVWVLEQADIVKIGKPVDKE